MQKTSLKKILSILLAIVMLATTCAISFGVSAEETEETTAYAGLTATDSGDCSADGSSVSWAYYAEIETLVISGEGTMASYSNSSNSANGQFGGDRPWYDYLTDVVTVIVEDDVTATGTYAFRDMTSVTSISLPSSLTTLGAHSMWGCSSLESLVLPEGMTAILAGVFNTCESLTYIYIPSSVTSIDNNNFTGLSDSVVVFYGGSTWSSIAVGTTGNTVPSTIISGVQPDTEYQIGTSTTYWSLGTDLTLTISGSGKMSDCTSSTGTDAPWYSFTSAIKTIVIEEGITYVMAYGFYGSAATSVSLPSTLDSIGTNAFRGAAITSIAIPSGVTTISGGTFRSCESLTTVYLPSTMKTIATNAFNSATSITTVYYEGSAAEYSDSSILSISGSGNPAFFYSTLVVNYNFEPTGELVEVYLDPTCVVDGSALYTCTTTGLNYIETIAATGSHTYSTEGLTTEDENYEGGTCTTNGYWTDVQCEFCTETTNIENPDSTIDHTFNYGDCTDDNYTDPVCGTDGYWTLTCTMCDTATTKVNDDNTALDHVFSTVYVHYEATCYTTGYETMYCDLCGKDDESVRKVIPATGEHTYGDYVVTTPATCLATGTATATCEVCHAAYDYIEVEIDPNNHTYVDGVCECGAIEPEESETPEVEEEEVEVSFIDKMMAWINELLAAFVALFSF